MTKKETIKKIVDIIKKYGAFSVGEVQADSSPCVNDMGGLIALAEYFAIDKVDIEVYEPRSMSSDSVHSYTLTYEELNTTVLKQILELAKEWKIICEE